MPRVIFLFIILISTASCRQRESVSLVKPLREVTGGQIQGEYLAEDSLHVFRGIPFAAPPVGNLRWKAPQPVIPWEGVKETVDFGPSPFQTPPRPFFCWSAEFLIPESPISEDCLYLNVWTPAVLETEKLPVLVYIYGGGFQSGGSACPIYEGASMAEKGLVFVSFNYRVGKFGFLAHPELSAESESGTSGNYGILDMIAALKWVRENITSFGGDPENVTIAGQSAGSAAVNILTASPLAKGLFHKVIGESGAIFYNSPLRRTTANPQMADSMGHALMTKAGVSSMDALRKLPADSILSLQGGLTTPYTDGYVLPADVRQIYQEGRQNDVPMLMGWNEDDIVYRLSMDESEFRGMVSHRFGDRKSRFYEAYPVRTTDEIQDVLARMSRDEAFAIQVYTWAKMQDSTGNSPAYVYNFNRSLPAYTPETQFGAFHSGEIVYAYDNLHTLDRPWEEVDHHLTDLMSSYWVNFIRTGNPNGAQLPEWKPYSRAREHVLVIDSVTQTEILPDREKLKFWENSYR